MPPGNINTEVKTNIVNYLVIATHCPKCHQAIGVPLGMVHRSETVGCPNCLTLMTLHMEGNELDSFVSAFDNLYEQLKKSGLPLAIFHNPVATMWEAS